MKIGLVCNFYIYNYGSILQSYALQQYIRNEGYDLEVINYHDVANTKQKIDIFLKLKWKNLLDFNKITFKLATKMEMRHDNMYFAVIRRRNNACDEFVVKHFPLSKKCNSIEDVQLLCEKYDLIVLSSDQLWGPEDLIRDYHTLRQFPKTIKRVAYATSFGISNIPSFLKDTVRDFIPQIECVSVREKTGKCIIKEICGRDVPVVVDPTMLLTKEQWRSVISEKKIIAEDYLFCYFLGENKEYYRTVKAFCEQKKLKIVSILHPEQYNRKKYRFANLYPEGVGPTEFLNLIYNAEYVACDSFHASVFSVIFNKKFMVFDRYSSKTQNSRNTRIENLLDMLQLKERHFYYQGDFADLMDKDIEWCLVSEKLEEKRRLSMEYLHDSLK